MATGNGWDSNSLHEDLSPKEESTGEAGGICELLTRIELDLAYLAEKALNLDILLMHVADRASDHETLAMENEITSHGCVKKAFEFSILSGVLHLEAEELNHFIHSLERNVMDARQRIFSSKQLEMPLVLLEEKLRDAEESLKQSRDQVYEIIVQSEKFERIVASNGQETYNGEAAESLVNGNLYSLDARLKTQTVEQQRHTLQMLEKSLARELDLERKLSDAKHNEEELKLKLHYLENETYHVEGAMETILESLFEAENSAEVLLGISRELTGELHAAQYSLSSSLPQENGSRSDLDEAMWKLSAGESDIEKLKTNTTEINTFAQELCDIKASLRETDDKCIRADSDILTLREKVNSLEEKLTESNIELQIANVLIETSNIQQNVLNSQILNMEITCKDLKDDLLKAEIRAEIAEEQCMLIGKAHLDLKNELDCLKDDKSKKINTLELKLNESNVQLENAHATVVAMEQKQKMLYSELSDMENLIKDMKKKFSNAEKRAENAESNCILLTETNLGLTEELDFLRGKLGFLEVSLHRVNDAKITIAKDIGIKTKIITNLVMKLAIERERLQTQICALRKENKILSKKWEKPNNNVYHIITGDKKLSSEEAISEFGVTNLKVEGTSSVVSARGDNDTNISTCPVKDDVDDFKVLPVRGIELWQLNLKHIAVAALAFLVAVLGIYTYRQDNCPA